MRTGKCLRCGRCCRYSTLIKSCSIWERIILYILRPRIIFADKEKLGCPFLSKGEKGKYVCRNYLYRPQFCKDYPATKNDLIDNDCGYKIL